MWIAATTSTLTDGSQGTDTSVLNLFGLALLVVIATYVRPHAHHVSHEQGYRRTALGQGVELDVRRRQRKHTSALRASAALPPYRTKRRAHRLRAVQQASCVRMQRGALWKECTQVEEKGVRVDLIAVVAATSATSASSGAIPSATVRRHCCPWTRTGKRLPTTAVLPTQSLWRLGRPSSRTAAAAPLSHGLRG